MIKGPVESTVMTKAPPNRKCPSTCAYMFAYILVQQPFDAALATFLVTQ